MKKSDIVIYAVCILVLCGLLLANPIMDAYEKHQAQSAAYDEACGLMAQERWSEASVVLGRYDVFKDLSKYCEAKSRLKHGDTVGAEIALRGVSPSEAVNQLRREIEDDMPAYCERERQKEEQRLQAEKAAARQGVPYVGMDEDWIDITSLGAHNDLRHNSGDEKRRGL